MFEYCATFILDVQCLIRSWRRMYSRNNLRKIAAFHGDETIQARSHWCFWIDLFEKGSYTRNFWASWWYLLFFLPEPIIQLQKCNWLDVLFYCAGSIFISLRMDGIARQSEVTLYRNIERAFDYFEKNKYLKDKDKEKLQPGHRFRQTLPPSPSPNSQCLLHGLHLRYKNKAAKIKVV